MIHKLTTIIRNHPDSPQRREHLRFNLLLLFVFTLPFDILYSNITLFLLVTTTLLDFKIEKIRQIPRQVWIFQMIYFLSVAGYFYSSHKHAAGFLLERQLAILLIPLLLPLAVSINEKRKRQLLTVFLLSAVSTILFLLLNAFLVVRELQLPFTQIFSKEFFNHRFSAPIGIHAGYLSMYVAVSIIYGLQQIKESTSKKRMMFLGGCLAVLCCGMVFLASRNMLLSTILVAGFIFPFYYAKHKLLYITGVIVLLGLGFVAIYNIPYLKKRLISEFIGDIKSVRETANIDVIEPRIERWQCAMHLVAKSPVLGYGSGDEIPMLKVEYIKRGLYISYLEEFNAHNQYLSYVLKNGIIGLLIVIATFGYFVQLAYRRKDFMYLSFLIIVLIGFFTENILDANKGIYFFALFNTFLGYTLLKANKNSTETAITDETEIAPQSFL